MIMSINDFILEYSLKNKTTSNMKNQNILSSLTLSDVRVYLREGPFESDIGSVNLHAWEGTHWVAYINQYYFDFYGCSPPQKLSTFIRKRNGLWLYSEYKTKRTTSKRGFLQPIVYIQSTWQKP